jgi:outer membrane lipase/esterase
MPRLTSRYHVWWQVSAVGLAIVLSVISVQLSHAQTQQSFSALTGQPNLTALPGQNGAQQAMAGSVNNVCPTISTIAATPDQTDLATICKAMTLNALVLQGQTPGINIGNTTFGLNVSELNGALQQLNGGAELLVPTSQASIVQTTQTSRQTGAIEKRLNELRNWTTGTVVAESPQMGQIAALSSLEPGSQGLTAQNQAPPFSYSIGPFGVFANGFGQFGNRDLTTTENGYSFNNAGFITGADYRFMPQLVAGLAFGYSQSNTNFDTSAVSAAGQSLNGNLLQGNLYATYSLTDAWYMNAIGLIGGGNNNSQRHIVFGTNGFDATNNVNTMAIDRVATGNFSSRVTGVTLATGYDLPFGPLLLTPIARFLYQKTRVSAFNEEGALGADLQYGSSSVNTVLSFFGADAQYTINTSFGPLYPIARFHWAHQYNPGNTSVSVAYGSDPSLLSSFILPGTPTSRNYFDLGVGLTLQLSGTSSAYINYDSILGISNTTYNSFTAGVRFTF